MLIVSYDISDDKLRTRFSKFLSKFGYRLQYSMYEIKNSKRILDVIEAEVKTRYEKDFDEADSILLLRLSQQCKITRYGYARNDDEDLIII